MGKTIVEGNWHRRMDRRRRREMRGKRFDTEEEEAGLFERQQRWSSWRWDWRRDGGRKGGLGQSSRNRSRVSQGDMQRRGMSRSGFGVLRPLLEDASESRGSRSRGNCSRSHTDIGDFTFSRFSGRKLMDNQHGAGFGVSFA